MDEEEVRFINISVITTTDLHKFVTVVLITTLLLPRSELHNLNLQIFTSAVHVMEILANDDS